MAINRNFDALVSQVQSGQYAGYLWHPLVTNLPDYKECKVQHTGFFVNKVNVAFALRKNSSLTQNMNAGLLRLMENGELKRLLEEHMITDNNDKDCGESKKGQELGFENILVVFILLLAGMMIALVVLLLEFCWKCC